MWKYLAIVTSAFEKPKPKIKQDFFNINKYWIKSILNVKPLNFLYIYKLLCIKQVNIISVHFMERISISVVYMWPFVLHLSFKFIFSGIFHTLYTRLVNIMFGSFITILMQIRFQRRLQAWNVIWIFVILLYPYITIK